VLLKLTQFHKKLHGFTLIAVILWLSGFGCSFCCIQGAVTDHYEPGIVSYTPSTPSANETQASQESCPKEELDCCKKRVGRPAEQANSQPIVLQESEAKSGPTPLRISQPAGVVRCSLLPKHIPSLMIAPSSFDNLDVEAEPINSTFATIAESSKLEFIHPVLPHNRGGTYLRCCVFLI
jgi:hypothetical protein